MKAEAENKIILHVAVNGCLVDEVIKISKNTSGNPQIQQASKQANVLQYQSNITTVVESWVKSKVVVLGATIADTGDSARFVLFQRCNRLALIFSCLFSLEIAIDPYYFTSS